MSSEFEWGRDQARSGGGWRDDFSQAESSGYHYQQGLNGHENFMREDEQHHREAQAARRRAGQAAGAGSSSDEPGYAYGGAVPVGDGDWAPALAIAVGALFGIMFLWPLVLALMLLVGTWYAGSYAYDLCRHRQGFRPVDVVLDGVAQDAKQALPACVQWLAKLCRRGQHRAASASTRLAHRARIADSIPTRMRTRAGRAVLRVARRAALNAGRLLMQGFARIAGTAAWGLERMHAAC